MRRIDDGQKDKAGSRASGQVDPGTLGVGGRRGAIGGHEDALKTRL